MTTLSDQELFGQVRSLLHTPASTVSWARLCTLLDAAREPMLSEQLVPYACEHMKSWPDTMRRLPRHWCNRLNMGHELPQLALVKHIVIQRPYHGATIDDALCEAIESGVLCPTRLELHPLPDSTSTDRSPLLAALARVPLQELDAPGLDRMTSAFKPLEEVMNLEELRLLWSRDELEHEHHQLDVLTTAKDLPALVELGLTLSPTSMERNLWASHIHNSPLRERLEVLRLSVPPYTAFQGEARIWESIERHGMFTDETWAELHTLSLHHVELPSALSSRGLRAKLPALRTLDLEGCVIDLEGLRGILQMFRSSPVERLNLSRCNLGAQALALLAEDEIWRARLTHLSLSQNAMAFDVDHLHDVFGGRTWPELRSLNIGFTDIRCTQLEPMEAPDGSSLLPKLEKLVLGSARLSESAYYALARSALPALHTLYCANMEVTGVQNLHSGHLRTLKQMSTAPWFSQLKRLELPSLKWDDAMYTYFAGLELPQLRELYSALDISLHLDTLAHASWMPHLDILRPEAASPPGYDGRIAPHYHELVHNS